MSVWAKIVRKLFGLNVKKERQAIVTRLLIDDIRYNNCDIDIQSMLVGLILTNINRTFTNIIDNKEFYEDFTILTEEQRMQEYQKIITDVINQFEFEQAFDSLTIDPDARTLTKALCTNTFNYLIEQPGLSKPVFDITQSVQLTNTIIQYLLPLRGFIGIQPLTGPIGLVYGLTVNSVAESEDNKQFSIEMKKYTTTCISRKLQASYNIAQEDVYYSNVDIMKELLYILGKEIGYEIVLELIYRLVNISPIETIKVGKTKKTNIESQLTKLALDIGQNSRRGVGNRILTNQEGYEYLLSNNLVTKFDSVEPSIIQLVGSIGEPASIQVYVVDSSVLSFNSDTHYQFLMAYCGNNDTDTGMCFAPYQLVMNTGPAIDPETFCPSINFMIRYDIPEATIQSSYYKFFQIAK